MSIQKYQVGLEFNIQSLEGIILGTYRDSVKVGKVVKIKESNCIKRGIGVMCDYKLDSGFPCTEEDLDIMIGDQFDKKEDNIRYIKVTSSESDRKFKIEQDGLNLKVKTLTENPITLHNLCKYLLTDYKILDSFTYKRKSPFKIRKIKPSDEPKYYCKYEIDFINIHNMQLDTKLIMRLNGCEESIEKECEIFIPDLVELMVKKGYLKRESERYKISNHIHSWQCRFEEYTPLNMESIESLKKHGFTIPKYYENKYNENN